MTYNQKMQKVIDGEYTCDVPPVCTANWNLSAWIIWINSNGKWVDDPLSPNGCYGNPDIPFGDCAKCHMIRQCGYERKCKLGRN